MTNRQHWLVVPAAGTGQRMIADRPKQYLSLAGRFIVDITISRLLGAGQFSRCIVALNESDDWWSRTRASQDSRVQTCVGGNERADSVLASLNALATRANSDDWVLVHDVARPCLALSDLIRLLTTLDSDPVGGLLASRVTDTIKRSDTNGRVQETVSRDNLWRALTPQQFRYGLLREALEKGLAEAAAITDEASAMERMGHLPRLIEGRSDNIKVTVPEDLALAGWILEEMEA